MPSGHAIIKACFLLERMMMWTTRRSSHAGHRHTKSKLITMLSFHTFDSVMSRRHETGHSNRSVRCVLFMLVFKVQRSCDIGSSGATLPLLPSGRDGCFERCAFPEEAHLMQYCSQCTGGFGKICIPSVCGQPVTRDDYFVQSLPAPSSLCPFTSLSVGPFPSQYGCV